jgi:hypothetical protein
MDATKGHVRGAIVGVGRAAWLPVDVATSKRITKHTRRHSFAMRLREVGIVA